MRQNDPGAILIAFCLVRWWDRRQVALVLGAGPYAGGSGSLNHQFA